MPWKIFIFKAPQAYHWKLLIEICPNPVQPKTWTVPPKVRNSKIFKKKNIFWLPKPKMRRALKRSKMSFSSKSDFYRPRHLIFNKSINNNFWLKKIPRKRIIAGTRPIIIKKVTISKEKKIFFKKSMYFHYLHGQRYGKIGCV